MRTAVDSNVVHDSGLRLLGVCNGTFELYSQSGNVQSVPNFYNTTTNPISAVKITDFIGSHGIYLDGEITGHSGRSIYAAKNIHTAQNAGGLTFAQSNISGSDTQ